MDKFDQARRLQDAENALADLTLRVGVLARELQELRRKSTREHESPDDGLFQTTDPEGDQL